MTTSDYGIRCCETPGCFKTAYGIRLCSLCLTGRLPSNRGCPTGREWRYARLYGGVDRALSEERMRGCDEPPSDPDPDHDLNTRSGDQASSPGSCLICGEDVEEKGALLCQYHQYQADEQSQPDY